MKTFTLLVLLLSSYSFAQTAQIKKTSLTFNEKGLTLKNGDKTYLLQGEGKAPGASKEGLKRKDALTLLKEIQKQIVKEQTRPMISSLAIDWTGIKEAFKAAYFFKENKEKGLSPEEIASRDKEYLEDYLQYSNPEDFVRALTVNSGSRELVVMPFPFNLEAIYVDTKVDVKGIAKK